MPELPFDKKLDIAEDHLKRLVDLKGEKIAVREFRGLHHTIFVEQQRAQGSWRSLTCRVCCSGRRNLCNFDDKLYI
ncbi:MAG: hypothetical protein ACLS36_03875 [Streptococcus sp.]